jgi:hypothetical protein
VQLRNTPNGLGACTPAFEDCTKLPSWASKAVCQLAHHHPSIIWRFALHLELEAGLRLETWGLFRNSRGEALNLAATAISKSRARLRTGCLAFSRRCRTWLLEVGRNALKGNLSLLTLSRRSRVVWLSWNNAQCTVPLPYWSLRLDIVIETRLTRLSRKEAGAGASTS